MLSNKIVNTKRRHSSPKHFPRGTNSPKLHPEYRPNINDLKQFFDDSKRLNVAGKSKNYGDAKPSLLPQDDLLFEGKSRQEFERVKQKFDSRHSAKSYNMSSSSKSSARKADRQRNARSSETSFDDNCKNNMNILEIAQSFGGEASGEKPSFQGQILAQSSLDKQDNTIDLAGSFNLDGFKVSEDDDDDDVSS